MLLTSAPAIEKVGFRWFKTFGGVLVIEAQKQIYAGSALPQAESARRRAYVRVVGGTRRASIGERNPRVTPWPEEK